MPIEFRPVASQPHQHEIYTAGYYLGTVERPASEYAGGRLNLHVTATAEQLREIVERIAPRK